MKNVRITTCLLAVFGIAACSEPPPPVSVGEFMENPRLLEATMVRCGQNRSEMKYEAECLNARDAINRLERAEERERRVRLEAQSERKRQQLRATQEAAAAARRRAEEAQRQREEAEYLGIFEEVPAAGVTADPQHDAVAMPSANAPGAVLEPATEEQAPIAEVDVTEAAATAPVETPATGTDLSSVREELKRRQEVPE